MTKIECPKCEKQTLKLPLDRNSTSKFDKAHGGEYGDTLLCEGCAVAESFFPDLMEYETNPSIWAYVGDKIIGDCK